MRFWPAPTYASVDCLKFSHAHMPKQSLQLWNIWVVPGGHGEHAVPHGMTTAGSMHMGGACGTAARGCLPLFVCLSAGSLADWLAHGLARGYCAGLSLPQSYDFNKPGFSRDDVQIGHLTASEPPPAVAANGHAAVPAVAWRCCHLLPSSLRTSDLLVPLPIASPPPRRPPPCPLHPLPAVLWKKTKKLGCGYTKCPDMDYVVW